MAFEIIQVVGAGTGGTQDGVSSIFVPQDGELEGIQWSLNAILNADSEFCVAELSFVSTNQQTVNDARGPISTIRSQVSAITAAGTVLSEINLYVPMGLAVQGGERIFLHIIATAGVVSTVVAQLHYRTGGAGRRALRRV